MVEKIFSAQNAKTFDFTYEVIQPTEHRLKILNKSRLHEQKF